jgi:hypothetical protein
MKKCELIYNLCFCYSSKLFSSLIRYIDQAVVVGGVSMAKGALTIPNTFESGLWAPFSLGAPPI